jgi:hypothetical protein
MGRAYGKYSGYERCIQCFGGETCGLKNMEDLAVDGKFFSQLSYYYLPMAHNP